MGDQVQAIDVRVINPVEADIKNWAESARPPIIKNTVLKTYILDSAGTINSGNRTYYQISDYEPRRVRMAIWVLDQNITLLTDPPNQSPNLDAGLTTAPQGALLPISNVPYEFFGPDAFWINSLNATARVVVVKEYC